jgi:hypothetical protein
MATDFEFNRTIEVYVADAVTPTSGAYRHSATLLSLISRRIVGRAVAIVPI